MAFNRAGLTIRGPIPTQGGGLCLPLSSSPLPLPPLPSCPSLPPLPLEVGPLNQARGSGGAL